MEATKALAKATAALLAGNARKTVVYVSPKLVVSICRRFKPKARERRQDFVVKIGAPNYKEAPFVKACVAAGEPFPVRQVQFYPWPVKRKLK